MKKGIRNSLHYYKTSFLVIFLVLNILFLSSCANGKSNNRKNDDMGIFTLPGHPVFYGTVESAKDVWEEYLDETVILPNSNQKYNDEKTLIVIEGYGSNYKLLNSIQLYFKNTSEGFVDLNTALEITKEYLPIETMRAYYEFDRSYILEDINPNETDTFMYIVHYKITEDGLKKREQTKQNDYYTMPSEIYIKLSSYNRSTNISLTVIDDSLDNSYWDMNYLKNGLKETDWHYDFLSH